MDESKNINQLKLVQFKDTFVSQVVSRLMEINKDFEGDEFDIPLLVSALDTYLVSDFSVFLKDIQEKEYVLDNFGDGPDEGDISFSVLVNNLNHSNNMQLCESDNTNVSSYVYEIELGVIDDIPIDAFTSRHFKDIYEDWLKSYVSISKQVYLGTKKWDKGKKSLEEYKHSFPLDR